jgi:hypothetical protein
MWIVYVGRLKKTDYFADAFQVDLKRFFVVRCPYESLAKKLGVFRRVSEKLDF